MNNTRLPTWLSDYFRANPASTVWQSALGVGGIVLTIHFAYIGFFPDLDWKSSLALLAIIALTGLFIWAFICLVMVFPSYVWSMFLEDGAEPPRAPAPTVCQEDAAKIRTGAAADLTPVESRAGKSQNSPAGPGKGGDLSSLFKLVILFGFPPLAFCILAVIVIWLGWGAAFENPVSLLVIFVAALFLAGRAVYRFADSVRALGSGVQTPSFRRYFGAVFFGTVVIVVPITFISALVYSRYNPNPWRAIILIVAVFLAFLYNLVALRWWVGDSPRERTGAGFLGAVSIGSIFLVSLLALTGTWVLIPEGVASVYGIGNVEGATLLLNKEGCSTAGGLGLRRAENNEGCRLDDVKILNRLGTTYYVKTPEGITFTLPSSSVKSHQVRAPVRLEVNIVPAGGDGSDKALKVMVTNTSRDDISDVKARVDLLDGEGHLRQSDRVEVGDVPAGQTREGVPALVPPSYTGERNYYVFLSSRGRELPYKRNW